MPYKTDTEAGIRRLNQIAKLPVSELTDEEHIKYFFKRFDCESLVITWLDKEGEINTFGRLRRNKKARGFIDHLYNLISRMPFRYENKNISGEKEYE